MTTLPPASSFPPTTVVLVLPGRYALVSVFPSGSDVPERTVLVPGPDMIEDEVRADLAGAAEEAVNVTAAARVLVTAVPGTRQ